MSVQKWRIHLGVVVCNVKTYLARCEDISGFVTVVHSISKGIKCYESYFQVKFTTKMVSHPRVKFVTFNYVALLATVRKFIVGYADVLIVFLEYAAFFACIKQINYQNGRRRPILKQSTGVICLRARAFTLGPKPTVR